MALKFVLLLVLAIHFVDANDGSPDQQRSRQGMFGQRMGSQMDSAPRGFGFPFAGLLGRFDPRRMFKPTTTTTTTTTTTAAPRRRGRKGRRGPPPPPPQAPSTDGMDPKTAALVEAQFNKIAKANALMADTMGPTPMDQAKFEAFMATRMDDLKAALAAPRPTVAPVPPPPPPQAPPTDGMDPAAAAALAAEFERAAKANALLADTMGPSPMAPADFDALMATRMDDLKAALAAPPAAAPPAAAPPAAAPPAAAPPAAAPPADAPPADAPPAADPPAADPPAEAPPADAPPAADPPAGAEG
jgi:hypothetical protein